MLLLGIGLVLFLGIHVVPMVPALRARLMSHWGEKTYRGVFSLVSLIGLVLLAWGKSEAPSVHVRTPPTFGRSATFVLLGGTALCFAALYMPTNLKRLTAHPMLWGTTFWALGHLLSNGDLASLWLFGAFLLWALADMVSANRRGARPSQHAVPLWRDGVVLVLAAGIYLGVAWAHPYLSGVPL
jgi:uncharacterized membrane protein